MHDVSQKIRLVYASRSTFTPNQRHQGLDPGVARILSKSRKNNASLQIVGGLLFGDGCFLQCLEGEAHAVETLYAKIESDRRHSDVKVLSRQAITQQSFGAWSMKYIRGEQSLSDLLHAWGATRFDPYVLSAGQIEEAVNLMRERPDAANTLPAKFDDAPEPKAVPSRSDRIVSPPKASSGIRSARPGASKQSGSWLWIAGSTLTVLVAGTLAYWRLG